MPKNLNLNFHRCILSGAFRPLPRALYIFCFLHFCASSYLFILFLVCHALSLSACYCLLVVVFVPLLMFLLLLLLLSVTQFVVVVECETLPVRPDSQAFPVSTKVSFTSPMCLSFSPFLSPSLSFVLFSHFLCLFNKRCRGWRWASSSVCAFTLN